MGRPAELRSPSAQGAPRRKGTCSLWLKRNWVLLALFALALASAGLSIRLYIVPCDEKTSYETTNTTSIVNVTSYFNQTVLENVRSRRGTPTRLQTREDTTPDAGHGYRNGLATREYNNKRKCNDRSTI